MSSFSSIRDVPADYLRKRNPFTVKAERVSDVKAEHYGKLYYFYVRIFLNPTVTSGGDMLTLDDIDFVTYRLDPTFKEPVRTSRTRQQAFEIKLWTFGYFKIKATIYTRWGQSFDLNERLDWYVNQEERSANGREVEW